MTGKDSKNYSEITEELINDLLQDLSDKKQKEDLKMFTGKNGVRYFAKKFCNDPYTFRQLLFLFRSGIVKGSGGFYSISTKWF